MLVWLLFYSFHVNDVRSFRVTKLIVRSPIRLYKILCFQNLENRRIAAGACRDMCNGDSKWNFFIFSLTWLWPFCGIITKLIFAYCIYLNFWEKVHLIFVFKNKQTKKNTILKKMELGLSYIKPSIFIAFIGN